MEEKRECSEGAGEKNAKEQDGGRKEPSGPSLPSGLSRESAENGESGPSLPSGLGGAQKDNSSAPALPSRLDNSVTSDGAGPALPAGLGGKKAEAPAAPQPIQAEAEDSKSEIFKNPQTLRWIGALQNYMNTELGGLVGKSNSVTDIVETVHRELMVGVERDGHVITEEEAMRVPDTKGAVAQSLLQFQNSHRPQDLWHFVTPDYRTGVVWLQLTSGDNRDMSTVARSVNDWLQFWEASGGDAESMVRENPEHFRPVLRSVAGYIRKSGQSLQGIEEAIAQSPV
jgi:hypothetical protein